MAENFMMNVSAEFDVGLLAQKLTDTYRMKGYTANMFSLGKEYTVKIEKGTGGINTLLGLGEAITANISLTGDVLTVSFIDAEWLGKIIGLVTGWFLCMIPFITAIIGTTRQLSLPKEIAKDIRMIVGSI